MDTSTTTTTSWLSKYIPSSTPASISWIFDEWQALLLQPGVPSASLAVVTFGVIFVFAMIMSFCASSSSGVGNRASCAQRMFGCWVRIGRLRNLFCSPCDRARSRYPYANTCQIPFFKDISDIYNFVFGYKTKGFFLEVGAYDGESFSNTSCLADLGWNGIYVEPIPAYAKACQARHASNSGVIVSTTCVGETDGVEVELSTAGPFSSAVEDEIATVSGSQLATTLEALGWNHSSNKNKQERVRATTVSLNTFLTREKVKKGGFIDVMVIDTEGFEWPILRGFDLGGYAPKLVIVEIQELQARYLDNKRVQTDADAIFKYFSKAGYSIMYKDVVNTVFIHKNCRCVGGN